jgi:hypothetical protein
VSAALKDLITQWGNVLPTQSIVLSLPILPLSQRQGPALHGVEGGAWEGARRQPERAVEFAVPALLFAVLRRPATHPITPKNNMNLLAW